MAQYIKKRHDLGLTHTDGTTYGLMLAKKNIKDVNGVTHQVPDYQVILEDYLSEQMSFGATDYRDLPPEKEIAFVIDDHREGFGEDVFDNALPARYWSSTGCDLRHKNRAMLSWGLSALTLPTTTDPTITDGNFELWDNATTPTNWTVVDTTANQEGAQKNQGTYSARLDTATGHIYQDLATTQIQGRRFTFTCYVYTTVADRARIAINDGITTTYSNYHPGDSSWDELTVTKTLSQSATRLRVMCYLDTVANASYFDGASACTRATYGTNKCSCDFGDNHYKSLGGLLTKLSSTTLVGVYEFPSTITSLENFGDGFLYIGLEGSQVIEDCEDAWTNGTGGVASLDTTDYKVGSGSCKIVYTAGAAGNKMAYENITALDLRDYTGVKFWIKASEAVAAADLCILLDDTAGVASPVETIELPALVAGVWTRIFIRLADPSLCTAIISVGLEYNANVKNNTFHLDDIEAESSYYYMDTGETLTQSTLAVQKEDSFAKYFGRVGDVMWKNLPPHNLYSTTDPSNTAADNWSTATNVSSPTYEITSLVPQKNSLFITKGDKPFFVEAGGAVEPLTEETVSVASSTGGVNSISWKGNIYMPYGTNSLLEYDSAGNFNWIEPSLYCTNLAAFDGQIFALAGDDQWLYAIVDNGASVEILAGRTEATGAGVMWVWHPYQTLTLDGCESASISSVTQKRLYIASTTAAQGVYYLPLPESYGNITSDTNRAFKTDGYLETPWHHLNFKGDSKSYIKLALESDLVTNVLAFDGTANSKIDCGAINDAAAKFWVSFRFKLDSDFSSANSTDQFLWSKAVDTNNTIIANLYAGNGKLYFYMYIGGLLKFQITSAETSWTAGTWYHVLASISSANAVRLRVDNGTAVTDTDTTALPNGGDFMIGYYAYDTAKGFIGAIADFACGTDDLSTTEEASLYTGTLPGDETDWWAIDEATGTSITSYGSDATTGTAGSACSWTTDNGGLVWLEAHYQKRGDSSYTDIGDFTTSPTNSNFIPVDASSNKPTATSMRFKFVGKAMRNRDTPILNSYDIRAILYPTRRSIILCTVRCADNIKDKQNLSLGCTAEEIKTWLEAARDATWPVTIKDIRGATKTVRVLPTVPFSRVTAVEKIKERGGENIEEHYTLALMVSATS